MSRTTPRQQVGLALAGLLSAVNVPSAFLPTPDGETGPPTAVLVAGAVLGLVGLVAVVIAWRTGNRAAVRVAAGTLVVNAAHLAARLLRRRPRRGQAAGRRLDPAHGARGHPDAVRVPPARADPGLRSFP